MKDRYDYLPNGYRETIGKGLNALHLFSKTSNGVGTREERLKRLKNELATSDAIVIGAGAGLSTSAGLTYEGERFDLYFFDFRRCFGITNIYSGGFYPFPNDETRWAWWARHIYFNRYVDPPKPVYQALLELVKDKNYFVVTTNVDHQFQRAGFDKSRLFYTQGDYGLFQSINRKLQRTYDNEEWVYRAMEAQGFVKDENGSFQVPDDRNIQMQIPTELIPKCPDDNNDVVMNLRSDDSFVEDEGWYRASALYADFLEKHKNNHVLYLELGVGGNTPVIIKYPFWQMTLANEKATYACLNYSEAYCPEENVARSICIKDDIGVIINDLKNLRT